MRSTLRQPMPDPPVAFDLVGIRLDFGLPLPELLRSVERQITRARVEVGFVFSVSGQLLVQRVGSAALIRFTSAELLRMPDGVLTHNHPGRGPLSREDVEFAHDHDLREIRAVAGRRVFRLLRPVAGWQRPLLDEAWESEERKIIRQYRQDRNRPRADNKMNGLVAIVVKRLSLVLIRENL